MSVPRRHTNGLGFYSSPSTIRSSRSKRAFNRNQITDFFKFNRLWFCVLFAISRFLFWPYVRNMNWRTKKKKKKTARSVVNRARWPRVWRGNSVLAFRSFRTHTATRPDWAGPGQDNVVITAPGHVFAVSLSLSLFLSLCYGIFFFYFPRKNENFREKIPYQIIFRSFGSYGEIAPGEHDGTPESLTCSCRNEPLNGDRVRPVAVRKGNSRGTYNACL